MKGARARAGDFEGCVVGIGLGGVAQWKLAVCRAERCDGDGLAIGWLLAPDERDLDHCAGRAGEHDAAGVDLTFANGDSGLAEAVRIFRSRV